MLGASVRDRAEMGTKAMRHVFGPHVVDDTCENVEIYGNGVGPRRNNLLVLGNGESKVAEDNCEKEGWRKVGSEGGSEKDQVWEKVYAIMAIEHKLEKGEGLWDDEKAEAVERVKALKEIVRTLIENLDEKSKKMVLGIIDGSGQGEDIQLASTERASGNLMARKGKLLLDFLERLCETKGGGSALSWEDGEKTHTLLIDKKSGKVCVLTIVAKVKHNKGEEIVSTWVGPLRRDMMDKMCAAAKLPKKYDWKPEGEMRNVGEGRKKLLSITTEGEKVIYSDNLRVVTRGDLTDANSTIGEVFLDWIQKNDQSGQNPTEMAEERKKEAEEKLKEEKEMAKAKAKEKKEKIEKENKEKKEKEKLKEEKEKAKAEEKKKKAIEWKEKQNAAAALVKKEEEEKKLSEQVAAEKKKRGVEILKGLQDAYVKKIAKLLAKESAVEAGAVSEEQLSSLQTIMEGRGLSDAPGASKQSESPAPNLGSEEKRVIYDSFFSIYERTEEQIKAENLKRAVMGLLADIILGKSGKIERCRYNLLLNCSALIADKEDSWPLVKLWGLLENGDVMNKEGVVQIANKALTVVGTGLPDTFGSPLLRKTTLALLKECLKFKGASGESMSTDAVINALTQETYGGVKGVKDFIDGIEKKKKADEYGEEYKALKHAFEEYSRVQLCEFGLMVAHEGQEWVKRINKICKEFDEGLMKENSDRKRAEEEEISRGRGQPRIRYIDVIYTTRRAVYEALLKLAHKRHEDLGKSKRSFESYCKMWLDGLFDGKVKDMLKGEAQIIVDCIKEHNVGYARHIKYLKDAKEAFGGKEWAAYYSLIKKEVEKRVGQGPGNVRGGNLSIDRRVEALLDMGTDSVEGMYRGLGQKLSDMIKKYNTGVDGKLDELNKKLADERKQTSEYAAEKMYGLRELWNKRMSASIKAREEAEEISSNNQVKVGEQETIEKNPDVSENENSQIASIEDTIENKIENKIEDKIEDKIENEKDQDTHKFLSNKTPGDGVSSAGEGAGIDLGENQDHKLGVDNGEGETTLLESPHFHSTERS
jgi:hypothetical protein